jgi:hypothetical protein
MKQFFFTWPGFPQYEHSCLLGLALFASVDVAGELEAEVWLNLQLLLLHFPREKFRQASVGLVCCAGRDDS